QLRDQSETAPEKFLMPRMHIHMPDESYVSSNCKGLICSRNRPTAILQLRITDSPADIFLHTPAPVHTVPAHNNTDSYLIGIETEGEHQDILLQEWTPPSLSSDDSDLPYRR